MDEDKIKQFINKIREKITEHGFTVMAVASSDSAMAYSIGMLNDNLPDVYIHGNAALMGAAKEVEHICKNIRDGSIVVGDLLGKIHHAEYLECAVTGERTKYTATLRTILDVGDDTAIDIISNHALGMAHKQYFPHIVEQTEIWDRLKILHLELFDEHNKPNLNVV